MKTVLILLAFSGIATIVFAQPAPPPAAKGGKLPIRWKEGAAAALDDLLISNPSNIVANVSQSATQASTSNLYEETSAGAASGGKESPVTPQHGGPEAYLEFEWLHIQDLTPDGPDGNRFGSILGLDCSLGDGFVLGGAISYAAERRATSTYSVATRSNDYIFAAYAGKNFADWINVGVTLVYDYQSRIIKSFALRADGHNHTLGVSPFVGIAHTWGNFSFSSTGTYIYQYNDVTLPTNTPGTNLSENFGSHGYLHINEFNYAITDKFTASLLANINVKIHQEPSIYSKTIDISDDFWMTWGTRLAYQHSDRLGSYCQFQADTFNSNFQNFTTTAGISLSF